MWGKAESEQHARSGRGVTAHLPRPAADTSPKMVLPGRIERPLPTYQIGVLPPERRELADSPGHDPDTREVRTA